MGLQSPAGTSGDLSSSFSSSIINSSSNKHAIPPADYMLAGERPSDSTKLRRDGSKFLNDNLASSLQPTTRPPTLSNLRMADRTTAAGAIEPVQPVTPPKRSWGARISRIVWDRDEKTEEERIFVRKLGRSSSSSSLLSRMFILLPTVGLLQIALCSPLRCSSTCECRCGTHPNPGRLLIVLFASPAPTSLAPPTPPSPHQRQVSLASKRRKRWVPVAGNSSEP